MVSDLSFGVCVHEASLGETFMVAIAFEAVLLLKTASMRQCVSRNNAW